MPITDNMTPHGLKILGQIELPEIAQEKKKLQTEDSAVTILPSGKYQLDLSKKWQIGAVIFYDGIVNEFGMIAVKAKKARTFRFQKEAKRGSTLLERGNLVAFRMEGNTVKDLVPINITVNLPWQMILRHIDFYEYIEFDYNLVKGGTTKGHARIPVLRTCIREMNSSDVGNLNDELFKQVESYDSEEKKEEYVKNVLACGIQTYFEKNCLTPTFAVSLLEQGSPYLADYRFIVATLLKKTIEDGNLSSAAKVFASFDGMEYAYDSFIEGLNKETGDWKSLVGTIRAFPEEEEGKDFFFDIVQRDKGIKPEAKVLFAAAIVKRVQVGKEQSQKYVHRLNELYPSGGITEADMRNALIAEDTNSGRSAILDLLPDDDALNLVTELFDNTPFVAEFMRKRWKRAKALNYVCFDIESDGNNITQAACIDRKDEVTEANFPSEIENVIQKISSAKVLVGHNIKKWDIPILHNKGLLITDEQFVWDTMEMELILSPTLFSYALETSHSAVSDASLCVKLFWNQVFRLVTNKELYQHVWDGLPEVVTKFLDKVGRKEFANNLEEEASLGKSFFRRPSDLDAVLEKRLSDISGRVLILAPQELWPALANRVDAVFPSSTDSQYLRISGSLIETAHGLTSEQRAILRTFVKTNANPLAIKLSRVARVLIKDEVLFTLTEDPGLGDGIICTDLFGIGSLGDLSELGITSICSTGYEIESRMNSAPLGEPFCAADLLNNTVGAKLLMQISGATFVPIKKSDCPLLHIPAPPADVQNVWMRKEDKGLYQVYCNRDFGEYMSSLSVKYPQIEQRPIEWVFSDIKDAKISILATKRNPHFDARMKRVNPTSLYRSLYWTYQFGLIDGVDTSAVKILYVTNPSEVVPVRLYAESLGYYAPAESISVLRRIELCAAHSTTRSIVVIGPAEFKTLREARIEKSICLLWDNLDTESLRVMWRGLLPFGDEPEYAAERKEHEEELPSTLACILSVWPMVKYFYRQLASQNPNNEICLLDPSFDDYRELEKSFLITRKEVSLWDSEDSYRESVKNAQGFFAGAKREEDLDIDFEHAKDTIRQIMLDPKVDNPPAKWTPIQEKALPQIFKRQSHSLISIPTGGGKSVLFQGPALYRAAFTNRLSIVITPLKALMQDQVNGLQALGFLTNVEYLNSDKSRPETSRIYRKITGGEIALLYVTPERFRSRGFRNALESRMEADAGLEYIIFDEAHCISQWGLDFRPEYLSTAHTCAKMVERFPDTRIELFSATVTGQVREDIDKIINPITGIGTDEAYNPVREHIGMQFTVTGDATEDRAELLFKMIEESQFKPELSRVLVFSRTRKTAEEVCELLKEKLATSAIFADLSEKVGYFHAGMDAEDRAEAFEKFHDGEYVILIATKAFGMGMDIPNIHYVYHLSPPQFIEDYLQEVGRAGRSRDMYERAGFNPDNPIPTFCFVSPEDFRNLRTLLAQSMLSWEDVRSIYGAVKEYVEKFQPSDAEQAVPIAVPDTVWKKETARGAVVDPTAFRLGLYWAERLQRLSMGYYASTTIDLVLSENPRPGVIRDEKLKAVYGFVKSEAAKWKDSSNVQIYINEICSQLSIGQNTLYRYVIKGTKEGLFSVINKTAFSLTKLRTEEIRYCIERHAPFYVINVIFEATRLLLSSMKVRESTLVDIQKRNAILGEAIASSGVIEATDGEQNRKNMPWYVPGLKGISKKDTYMKDLSFKRAKFIFAIIDMLPGTTVRSQIDDSKSQVVQEVYLSSGQWSDALSDMKKNCVALIQYLSARFLSNERDFIWTEAINSLRLPENYQYLNDLVSLLRMLGFINADGLLSTGIEISLTGNENEISELPSKEDENDRSVYEEFMEVNLMKEVRFALMDTFQDVPKDKYGEFIQYYFSCNTREDYMSVLSMYNEENSERMKALQKVAITTQEERLDTEQRKIYDEKIDQNINVIAGPGSGKTHVLTLRCAKLVYHHHILPQNILVLAYNRAVVEELKSRLARLFNELGYGRSMSQLQIYTFHGLAKKYCYAQIKDKPMEEWESTFLSYITNKATKGVFRAAMGNVQYILIDEFQDITQTRLDLMIQMRELLKQGNTKPKFFTIGDINQSIYGFDKMKQGHPMDPLYYYEELQKAIRPKKMSMTTNYRSYQGILDAAFRFIPTSDKSLLPHSSEKLVPPAGQYVFIKDNVYWVNEFPSILQKLKGHNTEVEDKDKIRTIAIFFRNNSEVYRGYSHLKQMNLGDVRIRLQGASGEFFRTRECYSLIEHLRKNPATEIGPDMKTKVKVFLDGQRDRYPVWNRYYFDLTYALALEFLSNSASRGMLYSDMADYLEDIGERDDGQLSKILQKHKGEFSEMKEKIEIVLTTMHKVKGLEFDVVVITPSYQPLGYDWKGQLEPHWQDLIGEERRLYYVAYTRAKKYLFVYRYPREINVERSKCYMPSAELQQKLGHGFDQGLDKFKISFTAKSFNVNNLIENKVSKNDEVCLERNSYGDGWEVKFIDKATGVKSKIGELSKDEAAKVNRACGGKTTIDSLFVSDVYVWRYEDTLRVDAAKNKNYAADWTLEAIKQGYILIADIAGYTGK